MKLSAKQTKHNQTKINYFFTKKKKTLTSFNWHSSGMEIVSGYSDGEIIFWSVKTSEILLKTRGMKKLK